MFWPKEPKLPKAKWPKWETDPAFNGSLPEAQSPLQAEEIFAVQATRHAVTLFGEQAPRVLELAARMARSQLAALTVERAKRDRGGEHG